MPNATPADAQVILQLYTLRTEATMRRARKFVAFEFSPQTIEEYRKVSGAFGTDENAYYRQVFSYWEMAASFVVRGAVNAELFSDAAGELFFLYAKFRQFIPQIRENNPVFMANMEKIVNSSKENQERVERMVANIAATRAAAAAKK
jgi:hypothetical protein